jgi:uncharacterized protein YndB with AHSA1/START domain
MNNKVQIKRVFDGSIEEVFDAWVNPEKLDIWHHPDGYSSKTKVNGLKNYEIEMSNNSINQVGIISGEYLEFDRPNRLVFTWSWNWQKDLPATKVEVDFKKLDESKTEIFLTHSGFMDEVTAKQHETGWGQAFTNLEKFSKGGEK